MSGGVDSSVAALLLKNAGYEVSGAYMKTWMNEEGSDLFANCAWEEDIKDARQVAEKLNIDFQVVNLIKDYRERVVTYLVEGYKNGTTPNPDIMCNREMKFGVFLDFALKNGFEGIATGHYCRRRNNPDETVDILEGLDKNKDQSYFLALVRQDQIQKVLFPIGDLEKPQVREIAENHNLHNAKKKDSQGICFLGKVAINSFLAQYIPERPGLIINLKGQVIGHHKGLHRYTLGQRKGIGIPSNTDFENYIVVSKNFETNELTVAFESKDTPGLYTTQIEIQNISFTNQKLPQESSILAKPRYRDPSQKIEYKSLGNQRASITFKEPQRALARGQLLGLYDGEVLLGGGFYS